MKDLNEVRVEGVDRALAALATTEGTRRLREHFAVTDEVGRVSIDDLTKAFEELRRRALGP